MNPQTSKKMNKNFLKKLKKEPVMKLINITDNINKYKKSINLKLLKLIERLDLDRPLMLREKLDIIWKEVKDDESPLNGQGSLLDNS